MQAMEPGCPGTLELAAFVERRLAPDEADRVRDHLDECDVCRREVLAAVELARGAASAAPGAPGALVLSHFELGARIGAGGMGVVYAARDRTLARDVAIKVLQADDPAAAARLLDEARVMARVRHPAVLTVYEAGVADGVVYIAMERIAGTTLRARLAERPPLDEIFELFRRAASGLAAAHAEGVIHRDFKPSNVLLELDGGRATRVLVADFGLAAAAAACAPIGGTPGYVAPEQRAGAPPDARADVYSFARSLWEALEGAPPSASPLPPSQLLREPASRIDRDAAPTLAERGRGPVVRDAPAATMFDTHGEPAQAPAAGDARAPGPTRGSSIARDRDRATAAGDARSLEASPAPAAAPTDRASPARHRIPGRLHRLLTAALSDDPAARPSLAALAAAIPVPARRRRTIVAIAAAAATAVVAVTALALVTAGAGEPGTLACDASSGWRPLAWRVRAAAAGVPLEVQHRVAHVMDERDRALGALAATACAAPDAETRRAWQHCREEQTAAEAAALEVLAVPWPGYAGLDDALELPWPSTCASRAARLALVLAPASPFDRALALDARRELTRADVARAAALPPPPAPALATLALHPAVRAQLAVELALREAAQLTGDERLRRIESIVELAERGGDLAGAARAWLALAETRHVERPADASTERAFAQAGWTIERIGDPPQDRARWLLLAARRAWLGGDRAAARTHARALIAIAEAEPGLRRRARRLAERALARLRDRPDWQPEHGALSAWLAAQPGAETAARPARTPAGRDTP